MLLLGFHRIVLVNLKRELENQSKKAFSKTGLQTSVINPWINENQTLMQVRSSSTMTQCEACRAKIW
jgi:hypothetical protein